MASPGHDGYARDMAVDSRLLGLVDLGALAADDPRVEATMNQVEERLWVHTDVGGLARFENDAYHQVERQDTKRVPGQSVVHQHAVAGALSPAALPHRRGPRAGPGADRMGRPTCIALGGDGRAAPSLHGRAAVGLAAHLESRREIGRAHV